MFQIPSSAETLLEKFSPAFTRPTYSRWVVWLVAAILTTGHHTVSNVLRTVRRIVPGHASTYHRVFSRRRWSMWRLSRGLTEHLLSKFVPEGMVYLAADDTVEEHPGRKVYGKGCHRDAVRSSHTYTAFRWGHKWVVLSILVQFSFARRPWALPVLVALYRTPAWNKKHHRRHRTPVQLVRKLVAVLLHWFPQRKFTLSGDGALGTHDLAAFAARHSRKLTLIARLNPAANLFKPPPPRQKGQKGRSRVKGARLPKAQDVVRRTTKRRKLWVAWYGGGRRRVEIVTGTGHWYKGGQGLVQIRWVFVHDLSGTHRDDYFFSTDPGMSPEALIGTFTGRWSIEVTFQEMRAYAGLQSTRGWSEKTVLRMAPCLFALYTVVAVWYAQLPGGYRRKSPVDWVGKRDRTFSDAITMVRRWIWDEWIFEGAYQDVTLSIMPRPLREILIYTLAPCA